jgi:hypothetical protein
MEEEEEETLEMEETLEAEGPCWRSSLNLSPLWNSKVNVNVRIRNPWMTLFLGEFFERPRSSDTTASSGLIFFSRNNVSHGFPTLTLTLTLEFQKGEREGGRTGFSPPTP